MSEMVTRKSLYEEQFYGQVHAIGNYKMALPVRSMDIWKKYLREIFVILNRGFPMKIVLLLPIIKELSYRYESCGKV